MKRTTAAQQIHTAADSLNDLIVDSITDIKGKKIVVLDLRALEDASTDFFIICEGDSATQIRSIADNIHYRLKTEAGVQPTNGVEGKQSARWICLDYFSTVVHVFYRETRQFYGLEDLWHDAKATWYED